MNIINNNIPKSTLACLFIMMTMPAIISGQTADEDKPCVTEITGPAPSATAYAVKYFIDKADNNSGLETGDLHIVYSDSTEVVEKLPPKEKSGEADTGFNKVAFTDPQISEDKRTIGWTENVDTPGTSYSVPFVISIYQSGKTILHIQQGLMVWFWSFRDEGKQVVAVWGLTHGPEVGDYQLYDIKGGKMLAEVFGDEKKQALDAGAPEWAKQAEQAIDHQR